MSERDGNGKVNDNEMDNYEVVATAVRTSSRDRLPKARRQCVGVVEGGGVVEGVKETENKDKVDHKASFARRRPSSRKFINQDTFSCIQRRDF